MTHQYDGPAPQISEHRALMQAFAQLFDELRQLKEQNDQLRELLTRINRPSVGLAD